MKRIGSVVVAGVSAAAIAGIAIATSVAGNASPLLPTSSGSSLECSYQLNPTTQALTGNCGSDSALGYSGGELSGQIDRAERSASGSMSLTGPIGSTGGSFEGGLTSGGSIVGEFHPAGGGVGIPFTAVRG